MNEQRKIRVAVVFGGRSSEHSISCASAAHVLPALDPARYEVAPIGIARDGRWLQVSGDPGRLAIGRGGELPSVDALATPGAEIAARPGGASGGLTVLSPGDVPRDLGAVDVVLPLLHGAYGEDGTIQGLLEMTGARYCGAGVFASAAGMDKEYMKLVFAAHGLPIGPYVVVRDRDWSAAPADAQAAPGSVKVGAVTAGPERKRVLDDISELGWPVFVKPARGGSSVGTSKARDAAELEQAIETDREHDPKVLVEAAIDGMEIECAVLEGADGGAPEASVPGQVMVGGGADFYDFEAKYLADETSMVIPAPIPDPAIAEVPLLAAAAFDAISCEGLARVDFFYTPGGQILLNEINTIPGMTAASYFPKMWAASGLSLPELIDRLLTTALRKQPGLR